MFEVKRDPKGRFRKGYRLQGPDPRQHRGNYRGVDKWIKENQSKHFCHCGCNKLILIKEWMHRPAHGIPKFLNGHYAKTKEYLTALVKRNSQQKGKDAYHWKGGVTKPADILRKSRRYIEWRNAVFARDNYTCQKCGAHNGNGKTIVLHAHHEPIPFCDLFAEVMNGKRKTEELFDPSLGITLCKPCHDEIPRHYLRQRKKSRGSVN